MTNEEEQRKLMNDMMDKMRHIVSEMALDETLAERLNGEGIHSPIDLLKLLDEVDVIYGQLNHFNQVMLMAEVLQTIKGMSNDLINAMNKGVISVAELNRIWNS